MKLIRPSVVAATPFALFLLAGLFPQAALLVGLEDRFDRFLLRGVDKRAGIDDEDIRFVRVGRDLHSMRGHAAEHDLGVDQILGAAEGDERDPLRRCGGRNGAHQR